MGRRIRTGSIQTPGQISHAVDAPRSYTVETASDQLRNHVHLRICSEAEEAVESVMGLHRPVT